MQPQCDVHVPVSCQYMKRAGVWLYCVGCHCTDEVGRWASISCDLIGVVGASAEYPGVWSRRTVGIVIAEGCYDA
jgi:hypothetical protein